MSAVGDRVVAGCRLTLGDRGRRDRSPVEYPFYRTNGGYSSGRVDRVIGPHRRPRKHRTAALCESAFRRNTWGKCHGHHLPMRETFDGYPGSDAAIAHQEPLEDRHAGGRRTGRFAVDIRREDRMETARTPNLDQLAHRGVQGASLPVCRASRRAAGPDTWVCSATIR